VPSTTRPRSVRSLSDLRVLIPRKAGPYIPCWRCGEALQWSEAAVTSTGDLATGYGHPAAACEPSDVAEWHRRRARVA
jgi:hypothetical protein